MRIVQCELAHGIYRSIDSNMIVGNVSYGSQLPVSLRLHNNGSLASNTITLYIRINGTAAFNKSYVLSPIAPNQTFPIILSLSNVTNTPGPYKIYAYAGFSEYGRTFLQVENNPNNRTTGVSVDVYWMRTRSTPPNGVMPFASYGLLHAHSVGSCNITASTGHIDLGTLFANTSEATKEPIALTNHGNSTAYVYAYGSKWISQSHYFGPTNTTYANLTGVPWALAGKIFDIQRNWIVSIAPGSSATVYIGADIPNSTDEGNYSQSIYFVSDCA